MSFRNEKGEKLLLVQVGDDQYVWANELGKLCMIAVIVQYSISVVGGVALRRRRHR